MAFTATTVLKKKKWDVYVYSAVSGWNADATWGTQLAKLEGEASIKASAGDTLKLATGIEAQISENGEVTFSIVGEGAAAGVLKDNYDALKTLINNSANVMFIPTGASNKATENVKLSGVYLFPELVVQANQVTKLNITAKLETGPGEALSLNAANNQ